ncbi:MAG: MAPEG family protein [Pseudomonadota bacterium]
MQVTALYAGLLGLLTIYLSIRVIDARRKQRVPRGDGGDAIVALRRGLQSNTLEYGLVLIVLLGVSESLGAPALLLHVLGLIFLAGRAFYIPGGRGDKENFKLRVRGMQLTFASLALASLTAIALSFAPELQCCRFPL